MGDGDLGDDVGGEVVHLELVLVRLSLRLVGVLGNKNITETCPSMTSQTVGMSKQTVLLYGVFFS